jgi:uncharacterized membrane protein YcaP (DUF421 family)
VDIVLRSVVVFVVLLVLTRSLGRRELAELEPFDVILLVVIGDLVQQGVTQSDNSLTGTGLAVATFALLTVGSSYVAFRFRRARPMLEGEPLVLVEEGRPIDANLRRERMTVEELMSEARLQKIATLDEIRWAVLETNGRVSFIPRAASPGG